MLKKTYNFRCKARITILVFLRKKFEFWNKNANLKSQALQNQNYCHIVLRGMNLQHYFVAFVNCTSIFHNYIRMVKRQINLIFADLSLSLVVYIQVLTFDAYFSDDLTIANCPFKLTKPFLTFQYILLREY